MNAHTITIFGKEITAEKDLLEAAGLLHPDREKRQHASAIFFGFAGTNPSPLNYLSAFLSTADYLARLRDTQRLSTAQQKIAEIEHDTADLQNDTADINLEAKKIEFGISHK